MNEEELKNMQDSSGTTEKKDDYSRFRPKNVVNGVIINANEEVNPVNTNAYEDVNPVNTNADARVVRTDEGVNFVETDANSVGTNVNSALQFKFYEDHPINRNSADLQLADSKIESGFATEIGRDEFDSSAQNGLEIQPIFDNESYQNQKAEEKAHNKNRRAACIAVGVICICLAGISFLVVWILKSVSQTSWSISINGNQYGNNNGSYDTDADDFDTDDFPGNSYDFSGFDNFDDFQDFFGDPFADFGDFGFPFGDNTPYGFNYGDDGDYADQYSDDGNAAWPGFEDYYEFHDEIEYDLSYQVDRDQYEVDNQDVFFWVDYPVIQGDDAKTTKLNNLIKQEISSMEDKVNSMKDGAVTDADSPSVNAYSYGYVTYMDEDVMSIAFEERLSNGNDMIAYLKCITLDIKKGVQIDNHSLVEINEQFAEEFKVKSQKQNGLVESINNMSAQEIMDYMNSDGLIAFYTPQGIEAGFNYPDGWVTVTYTDLSKYGEEL